MLRQQILVMGRYRVLPVFFKSAIWNIFSQGWAVAVCIDRNKTEKTAGLWSEYPRMFYSAAWKHEITQ